MESEGSSRSSPAPQPGTWAFGSRNSGSVGRGVGCLHTEQCVAGEVSSDSGWEMVGAARPGHGWGPLEEAVWVSQG